MQRLKLCDFGPIFCNHFLGSAKTDAVRLKWDFGEGHLKDKLPFSRHIKVLDLRGENCLQNDDFYRQKGPCLKAPLNWTRSVFRLLIFTLRSGGVLPKGVLDQHGRKRSRRPFWSKLSYSGEPSFSIRRAKWTQLDDLVRLA